jgi:hypothetical protein
MANPAENGSTSGSGGGGRRRPAGRKGSWQITNRVGHDIPTVADRDKWVAALDAITTTKVAAFSVRLTVEERRHAVKMPADGRRVVERVAAAARRLGLTIPNASIDDMERDLLLGERLQPLQEAAERLAATLDDTSLMASAECWWAATAYYSMLQRVSGADPQLDADLAELRRYFKKSPRPAPESSAIGEATGTATGTGGSSGR